MNAVERAKQKAARRDKKRPKKTKGQKKKQKMVVHGRPIERREVDRTTRRIITGV